MMKNVVSLNCEFFKSKCFDVLFINEKIESPEKVQNHLSTELPKSNRNIKKPFEKIPLISNEL